MELKTSQLLRQQNSVHKFDRVIDSLPVHVVSMNGELTLSLQVDVLVVFIPHFLKYQSEHIVMELLHRI